MSSSSITRPPYFTDNLRVENKIDYEEIKRATNVRDNVESASADETNTSLNVLTE